MIQVIHPGLGRLPNEVGADQEKFSICEVIREVIERSMRSSGGDAPQLSHPVLYDLELYPGCELLSLAVIAHALKDRVLERPKDRASRVFSSVPDPRGMRNQRHRLRDILLTAVMATICGANGFSDIAVWVESRLPSLQQEGMCAAATGLQPDLEGFEVISIDGKTMRSSGDGTVKPIHLVNAFAVRARRVLGQVKAREGKKGSAQKKGGELHATLELLDLLDVKDAIVTTNALNPIVQWLRRP